MGRTTGHTHFHFIFSEWIILRPEDSWARGDRTWICWCAVSTTSFQCISVSLHAALKHEMSDTISNPLTSLPPAPSQSSRAEDIISTPGPFRQEFNIFQLNQSHMVSTQCNPITFHHKCLFCKAIHWPDKLVEIKTLGKHELNRLSWLPERKVVPLLSVDTHFHFSGPNCSLQAQIG